MKITVIAVGKIKERYLEDAIGEYSKRLNRSCKLEIIQVADEKTPEEAGPAQIRRIKSIEGGRILAHVKAGAYVVALAIKGQMVSSEELAARIGKLGVDGHSQIIFVIGGSLGLADEVLERADWLLSFSPMTFPHQLMRVILLEQIYRSFQILAGTPYHK